MAEIANDPAIRRLINEVVELGYEAVSEGDRIAVSAAGRTFFVSSEQQLRTAVQAMRERTAKRLDPNVTTVEVSTALLGEETPSPPSQAPGAGGSTPGEHDERDTHSLAQEEAEHGEPIPGTDVWDDRSVDKLMRDILELGYTAKREATRIAVATPGRTLFARDARELGVVLETLRQAVRDRHLDEAENPDPQVSVEAGSATGDFNELDVYEQALAETEQGTQIRGLWAKCIAETDGDEKRAVAAYIRARVAMLTAENQPDVVTPSTSEQASYSRTTVLEGNPLQDGPKKKEICKNFDEIIIKLKEQDVHLGRNGTDWIEEVGTGWIRIGNDQDLIRFAQRYVNVSDKLKSEAQQSTSITTAPDRSVHAPEIRNSDATPWGVIALGIGFGVAILSNSGILFIAMIYAAFSYFGLKLIFTKRKTLSSRLIWSSVGLILLLVIAVVFREASSEIALAIRSGISQPNRF